MAAFLTKIFAPTTVPNFSHVAFIFHVLIFLLMEVALSMASSKISSRGFLHSNDREARISTCSSHSMNLHQANGRHAGMWPEGKLIR